uniref:Rhodopsin domain-containing protein n=1 Tax=Fusarium oxysporum (strain Fo5176) TaxID=660025 RepID=A0A0D2XJA9_FUSOF
MNADDWLVIAATLFSIGLAVPNYFCFPTGDVPDSYDVEPVLFYNWIMQVLYSPILALVKSSILFFLLRLGGHRRSIRWSIYALNTFNVTLMITIFTTVIFQIPIAAFWNHSVTPRRQIDGPMFYITTAIITIVTDSLVLLIPFWVFVGLKMRLAAKIGLIVVFLIGGVNSLGDILSSIEVNLATIVCCGPALRPLFRKMFPRLFSGRSTNETGKYNTPSRYGNCASGGGIFHLKDMHRSRTQTEIRGYSPNGSEEEIMTYNGILRTTASVDRNTVTGPQAGGLGGHGTS